MSHKHQNNRMKLPAQSLSSHAERHGVPEPAIIDPNRHPRGNDQTARDGRTLKVLCLPARIMRHVISRDIEPRQSGQPAQGEEGEQDVVERGADAEGEGGAGGRHAKGDEVGEGVELGAHEGGFAAPAGDAAVEEVEEETEGHEGEGEPEVGFGWGGEGVEIGVAGEIEAVAEGGEDGHDAAKAYRRGLVGMGEGRGR